MIVIRQNDLPGDNRPAGIHYGKPYWKVAWWVEDSFINGIEVVIIKYVADQTWWIAACDDDDDKHFKSIGPFEHQYEAMMYMMLTMDKE